MTKKNLRSIITEISEHPFVRDVWSLLSSSLLRLVFQSAYFIILARTFGPDQYGSYVGTIAIISLFIPFASLGSNWLLIQKVSRDPSTFAECYGTSILKNIIFGTAFICIILFTFSSYPIPNISIYSVLFLSLSNLIFMTLSDICRDAFIAVGLLKYTARVILLLSANRFLASLALVTLFKSPTLLIWSALYCIATLATAIISSILVFKLIGRPKFSFSKITQELAQGFSFSVGASAENIYNDLDKGMLVKLSTTEATGIYGAAFQIFSVSLTPLHALMMAAYRKFFQKGASGIKGSLELCKKLIPVSLGYSLLGMTGILILASFLPKILGEQYADSALALIWFSPLIFIRAIHSLGADVLTGANYQKARSTSQILVAFANGILNFWLIPLYQWRGAILATIVSEVLLMILLWSCVYVYSRRSNGGFT
ncbi:MAG: oligosaccharide flippase family protein [Leptolyngbyaceae cyanobacterium SM1_3_5]|nr:oligosaccharide flippase family protein [Leptolyngbyaceae cyanobacterium SM1_3_5]